MAPKSKIVYVTGSLFKIEENATFVNECFLSDGRRVSDAFEFDIRKVPIKEVLDVDLSVMVSAEVLSAYCALKVPCIVEHAGLIFSDYFDKSYPGGLTKPMWNALGDSFIAETGCAGRKVVARAVIAYCDGRQIITFTGEREGIIAKEPRGDREFYWDTVFMPNDSSGKTLGLTYAEIVKEPTLGLPYKVRELSQSSIAMQKFLEYRIATGEPELWR